LTSDRKTVARRTTVVFDLGGVLIDWDPRHLYRKLFPGDEAGMERFLAEICTSEWNLRQDAGRSWAEAVALLKAEHPGQTALIDAFRQRWPEMLAGPIEGSVAVLRELKDIGAPLYALTLPVA
jgi:2-haloacid dehalogenase